MTRQLFQKRLHGILLALVFLLVLFPHALQGEQKSDTTTDSPLPPYYGRNRILDPNAYFPLASPGPNCGMPLNRPQKEKANSVFPETTTGNTKQPFKTLVLSNWDDGPLSHMLVLEGLAGMRFLRQEQHFFTQAANGRYVLQARKDNFSPGLKREGDTSHVIINNPNPGEYFFDIVPYDPDNIPSPFARLLLRKKNGETHTCEVSGKACYYDLPEDIHTLRARPGTLPHGVPGDPDYFVVPFFYYEDASLVGPLGQGEVAIYENQDYTGPAIVFYETGDGRYTNWTTVWDKNCVGWRLKNPAGSLNRLGAVKKGPNTGASLSIASLVFEEGCGRLHYYAVREDCNMDMMTIVELYIVAGLAKNVLVTEGKLNGVDISGLDLTDIDLSGKNFINCRFDASNLGNVVFTDAILTGSSFLEANLKNAILVNTKLAGANFNNANLEGADLYKANMITLPSALEGFSGTPDHKRPEAAPGPPADRHDKIQTTIPAQFRGAYLKNTSLVSVTAAGVDFSDANFFSSSFLTCSYDHWKQYRNCATAHNASFVGATLDNALLKNVDLYKITAGSASFANAVLVGANLSNARLLKDPNLQKPTSFAGAYIQGTAFTHAETDGVTFHGAYITCEPDGLAMLFWLSDQHLGFSGYWGDPKKPTHCIPAFFNTPTTDLTTNETNTCPDGSKGPCCPDRGMDVCNAACSGTAKMRAPIVMEENTRQPGHIPDANCANPPDWCPGCEFDPKW